MGISTGYVRITSINADGGMVTGDVQLNDVVIEAAGVNMRRPISEGMWKLTLGLMEVAPLPLEIVVAQQVDEPADRLTNQDTGMEEEKHTGYYQLETPNKYNVVNDPVLSAKLYHLEDSCDFTHGSPSPPTPTESPPDSALVVRNPFLDHNRFGPERNIVFRTESLGVKLHRSSTEGIVHILHVTSYRPPQDSTMPSPRDGDLNEGDAIMEVGGVDLRNQFIGRLEWADMVHFIRYVERPLEMVVAKDTMFSREEAGLSPLKEEAVEEMDVYDVARESVDLNEEKVEAAVEELNTDEEDKKAEEECSEQDQSALIAIEASVTDALRHLDEDCNATVLDNVCSAVTDGLCTSPGADQTIEDGTDICTTPDEKTGDDNATSVASPSLRVPQGNLKKDNSWIKSPTTEQSGVMHMKSSPSRSPLTVFPRTHPTTEKDDEINSVSTVEKNEIDAAVDSSTKSPESESPLPSERKDTAIDVSKDSAGDECVVSPERKSVAELKGLFSPIKLPETPKRSDPLMESPVADDDIADVSHQEDVKEDIIVDDGSACVESPAAKPVTPNIDSVDGRDVDGINDTPCQVADEQMQPGANECGNNVERQPTTPAPEDCVDDSVISDESTSNKMEETNILPSEPSPAADIQDSYIHELGPTPEKPFDETANSSLHEELVNDLASEFTSPSQREVQLSDSRDDIEHKKHRDDEPTKKELSLEDTQSMTICPKPAKKVAAPPAKKASTPAPTKSTFNSLFVVNDNDSPFCGNIKFSNTPKDRVPVSALFSQAFVVQRAGAEEANGTQVTDHIRWESTASPLFVMKKGAPIQKTEVAWSPYPPAERTPPERLFPDPLVKGFDQIAFDMSELDVSANLSDEGSLSDDPSYNPNDTIVYADESEAQTSCCGFDSFCADNVMFEGLVSNCGADPETQRLAKEKANKVPSPRRKNLLTRLRKGNKKNKDKVTYGTLDDGLKESMKGIKKAHVQLRKQNLYGKSVEAASQYASMSDLIEI
jgi:hypothetical protein